MLNRIEIIGNAGKEPEMRFTPSGKPVTYFTVAVNRKYTNEQGEIRQDTEWFNIVTWARLAEACNQYIEKGQPVYVAGRLHHKKWITKDNQEVRGDEIVADKVIFLNRKPNNDKPSFSPENEPEDIPF